MGYCENCSTEKDTVERVQRWDEDFYLCADCRRPDFPAATAPAVRGWRVTWKTTEETLRGEATYVQHKHFETYPDAFSFWERTSRLGDAEWAKLRPLT